MRRSQTKRLTPGVMGRLGGGDARKFADARTLVVEDLEPETVFRWSGQIVINERAVRRIIGTREISLQRRIGMVVPVDPNRGLRNEELDGCFLRVVAVDSEVAHRGGWQIELQRLPVITVIERDGYAGFGAGEQHALANGIFANGTGDAGLGEPIHDLFPGLTTIACTEKQGMGISA